MKVLFFSDIHVFPHKHSTEFLQNCLNVLEWVFVTAKERGIEHVVFLGDLFHERQKIDVLTYQKTFEIFEKHVRDQIKVSLLLGNHDLWHLSKWDVSSVFPLRSIQGVSVIDKPSTILFNGTPISFLPYTANPIEDLKSIQNDSPYKILCGHCALDGAVLNTTYHTLSEHSVVHDGNMVKIDSGVFTGWDQILLGHYHAAQKIGNNIEYIGSPLQLSFGEAFQKKNIMIYDLETHEKEYIENTFSPIHLIISPKDIGKHKLDGNYVTLVVDDISQSDLIDLRKDIVENRHVCSLEIKQVEKKMSETLVEDAKVVLFNKKEMLQKYVEVTVSDLDKDKLLKIGQTICGVINA